MYGQTPLFYAAREGHLEVVKRLVAHGQAEAAAAGAVGGVDPVDLNGQTPLYYAAKSVRVEVAEYLIRIGGADVNHEDNKGETPIVIAKRTGKKPIINLLIELGAKLYDDSLKKLGGKKKG